MPRKQLTLIHPFRAAPKDLFLALSNTSYLQNWLTNKVEYNSATEVFTFHWTHYKESARIEDRQPYKFLKWVWVDADREQGEYVSFRILSNPGEDFIELEIMDFCEADEENSVRAGWEKQLKRLEKLVK